MVGNEEFELFLVADENVGSVLFFFQSFPLNIVPLLNHFMPYTDASYD